MEKREKRKKKTNINISSLVFCSTVYVATLNMLNVYTKFEDPGFHRSREICDRKFDWRGIKDK